VKIDIQNQNKITDSPSNQALKSLLGDEFIFGQLRLAVAHFNKK